MMSKLPTSWVGATIDDLVDEIIGGGTPSKASPENFLGNIPFMTVKDMNERFPNDTIDKINQGALLSSSAKLIPANTIIIATRMGLGKVVRPMVDVAINQDLKALFHNKAVDPEFLHWKLIAAAQDIEKLGTGTTVKGIRLEQVRTLPVPLPPIKEQKRIVVKIDNLTTRTALAQTELDCIPALVEKYKSAILDLAFLGKLTVDFRGARGEKEAELPKGWEIKLLGDIGEVQGGIQVGKKRSTSVELVEVPYLRVANVQRGWLNLDEIKSIAVTPAEKERLLLRSGDVLMNEGGDRDKLGRGWVWEDQVAECIHQNHVFRIRIKDGVIPSKFLSYYANEKGQQYFVEEGTQTTNLASISKRKIIALPVPVPPAQEAAEIVRRIETAFDWLSRIAADHTAAARLLPKLDAAILSRAFSGALVPQDPSDEPASILLARIQSERRNKPKKTPKRRKKVKQMPQHPSERLLQDSESWPDNGLPFEELAKRIKLPHDQMRDVLFSLLASENPSIRQTFDIDAECMHLQRVKS